LCDAGKAAAGLFSGQKERAMTSANVIEKMDVDGLYRRFGPMVLRRCRALLKNEEAAADAMQETFVRLLRNIDSLRAEFPSSLLYRIATNVCLNMMRSARRRPVVDAGEMLEALPGSEDVEARALDAMLVEQILRGVKPSTRQAARIHYLECATLEETAARVGMSMSGIRKRLDALRRQSLLRAAR
jgi:RNA polymerase sigma-70 factor (ECF subfamily)